MSKVEKKKKRGTLLLTNKLGKYERLNQEEMKILINGVVQGLAPVAVQQKGKKLFLQVDVTRWYPLTTYMNAPMNAETALMFLWNTLEIAYECERHGLRYSSLFWDPDNMYVDENGSVVMIYWPVTTLEYSQFDALNFYYSFCPILKSSGLDSEIADKYYQHFYQRSYFDINAFHYVVQDMMSHWNLLKKRKLQEENDKPPIDIFKPDVGLQLFNGWLEKLDTHEKILLEQEETVFGRDKSQCTVEISGFDGVSRRHAVIVNRNDEFYVMDLGSRNGTYLQGVRLQAGQRSLLHDGDNLRFGNARFLFREIKLDRTVSIHQIQRR